MTGLPRRYFGTDGIRGPANVFPLVPEFAVRLGRAVASVFLARRGPSLTWPLALIGKDTRQSGDMLESAFAAGVASCGVDVRLTGVIPTPAVARLVVEEGALFGAVISASHNLFGDNGIKLFGPDGTKLDDALEMEIERRLEEALCSEGSGAIGRVGPLDHAAERYVSFVRDSVGGDRELFRGLHVALDAANGSAVETSEAVLRSLGAKVSAFHHHPSGININLDCGCMHPEVISRLVRETGAEVGIAHDGDADRVLLCDETGDPLDGDEVMAIAALDMLQRGTLKGQTLVATVMSNGGLDEAVEAAGGRVLRAGVGDRYVLRCMQETGCNLGGEQSGHFIFRDHNATGDGILAAVQLLKILRESGRPLSELRRVMRKRPQVQRKLWVREKIPLESLAAAARVAELESRLGNAGRVLLRYSGTEALLRLLIEGPEEEWITQEAAALMEALRQEIGA